MMVYEIHIDVYTRAWLPRVQHVIIRPPLERHPPFAAGQNRCRTLLSSRWTLKLPCRPLVNFNGKDLFGRHRMTLSIAQQERDRNVVHVALLTTQTAC